jgi:hypothetical protein
MSSFRSNFGGGLSDNDIYYEVGQRRTHSKFEALSWANGIVANVTYSYMDKFWETVDWSVNPVESMDELLAYRCQQIRNNHSHVALWLSGGYDSQTILDHFIKNDLKIDEIITYKRKYLNHWTATAETNSALAQAKALKNTVWPNLKIVEVELSPTDLKEFYNTHQEDWILRSGSQSFITKSDRSYLFNFNYYLKRALAQSKRADVEGREKPRLWIENGKWYHTSFDSLTEWQMDSPCVAFYTSPDFPQLQIKQAWNMINWIESLPLYTIDSIHTFLHSLQSNKEGADTYATWNKSLGRSSVHSYGAYVSLVSGSKMWHGGDVTQTIESGPIRQDFMKHEQKIYSLYINGIKEMKQSCPTMFNANNEIVGIRSGLHYIKPVEPGKNVIL